MESRCLSASWRSEQFTAPIAQFPFIARVQLEGERALRRSFGVNGPVPPNWELRSNIIEKFEIDNTVSVESCLEIAQGVRAIVFESPCELSPRRVGAITQTFANLAKHIEARNLWMARDLSFFEPTGGNIINLHGTSGGAEKLSGRLKGREFKAARIAKSFKFHTRRSNQGKSLSALGPSAKIKALKNDDVS